MYLYLTNIFISYISYESSTVRSRFVRFKISLLIKKNVSLYIFDIYKKGTQVSMYMYIYIYIYIYIYLCYKYLIKHIT